MQSLEISGLYAAIFGLIYIAITFRVGNHRRVTGISFGDGGDSDFLKLIRGQQNYAENVPIGVLLGVLVEFLGASSGLVHTVFAALLIGRVSHYLQLTAAIKPVIFRMLGMVLTFLSILVSSIWLLINTI